MVKTAGYTLFIKVFSAILSFLLIVAISQLMEVADRGVCSLYLVVVVVVMIVSDFAGGATAAYQLNHFEAYELFIFQRNWSFVPGIVVPIFFWLTGYINLSDALMLIPASWFYTNWNMLQHLWLGKQQFKIFNAFTLGVPAVSLALFTLIWALGLHNRAAYLLALVGSWGIAFLVSWVLFMKKQDTKLITPGKVIFKKVIAAAGTNQLGHLAGLLHSRLIFLLLPATTLGVYSNALTLAEACFMVPGSLGQVVYSIGASKQPEAAKRQVLRLAWWTNFLLLALAGIVFAILPGGVYSFIFGEGFRGMSQYMQWLIPGIWGNGFYLLLTYWQSAAGKFKYNLISQLAALLGNIVITVVFLIKDMYTLEAGIFALVSGWFIAACGGLYMLHNKGGGLQQLLPVPSFNKIAHLLPKLFNKQNPA
jgi:O-antigen/teichoic acid export membrane protein